MFGLEICSSAPTASPLWRRRSVMSEENRAACERASVSRQKTIRVTKTLLVAVAAFIGPSSSGSSQTLNLGRMFVKLKPRAQRLHLECGHDLQFRLQIGGSRFHIRLFPCQERWERFTCYQW